MLARARRSMALPVCLGLATVGCGPEAPEASTTDETDPPPEVVVLSDFKLTLRPIVMDDADPFDGRPQVSVLITPPDGDTSYFDASNGALPSVGPLVAGTRIGVLVEDGGDPEVYEPALTLGYGHIVLEDDLDVGGVELEAEVFVPPFGDPGTLYEPDSSDQRFAAGVAMLDDGTTYIFGGTPIGRIDGVAAASTATVLRLDPGADEPIELELKLPEVAQGARTEAARAGLTATPFVRDGAPYILVAGGRYDWGSNGDGAAIAHVFDPSTESFVEDVSLFDGASDHTAVVTSDGDILLDGGLMASGRPTTNTLLFRADDSRVEVITLADGSGNLYRSSARMGDDGVLVCGGVVAPLLNMSISDWPTSDVCTHVTADGEARSVAPLPRPLVGHTMTPLPNGDILVTGGTDADLPRDGSPENAIDAAYVYDVGSNEWESVGDLVSRRMGHVAYSQPGGHVIVVGGVEAMGTLFNPETADFVGCAERFDVDERRFTELGCRDLGVGAFARVATAPDQAALVFPGFRRTDDGGFESSSRIGYASLVGPPSP